MATHIPLIKVPSDIEDVLFLIKEELKSRRFFFGLHSVGLDDIYLRPNLDRLILKYTGLNDGTDETFAFYNGIMDKRAMKIDADNDSIMKQALKVYTDLEEERRRRKHAKQTVL